MKRIAVLVLACVTEPYAEMVRTIRRTWGNRRIEGVDIFYVYGNVRGGDETREIARYTHRTPPTVEAGDIERFGDVLIAGCADLVGEQEDCLLWKRLLAFDHLSRDGDYDLIYTVCAASYVDLPQLVRNAARMPRTRAVSGPVSIDPAHSAPFVSGASMLLTADVARALGRRRREIIAGNVYGFRDDLTIGRWIASHISTVPLAEFIDDVVECRPLRPEHVFVVTSRQSVDYVDKARDRHRPVPGAHHYHFDSRRPDDMARFHRRHFDPRRHTVDGAGGSISQVQIFGERCSGTNYLAALVSNNFAGVELTTEFGWKHWFIRGHEPRGRPNRSTDRECVRSLADSDDTLFVVIHRDPFDWLRSLHRRPYHAPGHWNIPFSEFIRKPWFCAEPTRANPLWPESETGEYFIEEADNVVRLRTQKAEHFLGLGSVVRNVVHLRYEDLAADPTLLAGVAERFGITLKHPEVADETVHFGGTDGEAFESPRPYPPIADDDHEFIRATLDWEVEAKLGYTDRGDVTSRGTVSGARQPATDTASDRLLVILERDVGLFSMVEQVLNTLHLLERHRIDRIPVVLLGRDIAYFDPDGHDGRTTVWEYYFEPLIEEWPAERVLDILGDRALDLVASRRLLQERLRGLRDFPDRIHRVPSPSTRDLTNLRELSKIPAAADWQWTEDFTPTVDGQRSEGLPGRAERARLLKKWIRPRPRLVGRIEAFHGAHLAGHHVIGVHVRGTDLLPGAEGPSDLDLRPFFAEVDARLDAPGRESCRVLVASDDHSYVADFRERYGDLCVAYDAVRSGSADRLAGSGPTGQLMPGFLTRGDGRAVMNGADVVAEFGLLCRSDHLVHNGSTIARLASSTIDDSVRI